MFTGKFRESSTNDATIKNISCEAFHDFLRFCYMDRVENLSEYVIQLLQISHQYEVHGLKALCEAELLAGLTEVNASHIFQYSHLYDCKLELKEASFKLIQR